MGGITGFATTIFGWVVKLMARRLEQPGMEISTPYPKDDNKLGLRAWHVNAYNKPLSGFYQKLANRRTAIQCQIELNFYEKNTSIHLPFSSIKGRWTGNPEPQPHDLYIVETRDLMPGADPEPIQVVLGYRGESEVYAFARYSYVAPKWKNPSLKIEHRECDIEVTIKSAGEKWARKFRMERSDKNVDFLLYPVTQTYQPR